MDPQVTVPQRMKLLRDPWNSKRGVAPQKKVTLMEIRPIERLQRRFTDLFSL